MAARERNRRPVAPTKAAAFERTNPLPAIAVAPRWPLRTALLVGLAVFLVYLTNLRPMGAWDSVPARLLPFSILRQGNFDLDEFQWLRRLDPHPYFLRQAANGHWVSLYTVGVPLLVTPLSMPVVWWLQHNQISDDDVRFRLATVMMERVGAAAIAATSVALVFLAVSSFASTAVAAGVALAYGLSTSLWSVGSQALWQHGAAALALAGLSLSLLAADTRRNAAAAGGCAALAVLVRPTMLVFAALALLFIWRERRRRLLAFLSLPTLGMLFLLAYNLRLLGLFGGAYQRGRFTAPDPARFLGLLFSPSRGLFVYTPAALLAVLGMVQPDRRAPRCLAYLPFGAAAYLLLYSCWTGWWGGHCYGPRFLTDVLPALALCAVPVVQRWWPHRWGRLAIVLLVTWGVVVQVIGVYCDDRSWDKLPKSVDATPWRLWQWDDPQILRAAHAGWHGGDLASMLWQTLVSPEAALLRPLEAAQLGGEITLDDKPPTSYHRAGKGTLHLRVTNRGAVAWPAFSDFGYLQVALLYSWRLGESVVVGEGGAIDLPRNLGPGESTAVQARIDLPARPGAYTLEFNLLQVLNPEQGVSGGTTLRLPVQVE